MKIRLVSKGYGSYGPPANALQTEKNILAHVSNGLHFISAEQLSGVVLDNIMLHNLEATVDGRPILDWVSEQE